ncbi:hypothetical protein KC887_05075 [Candidatus Kaiserbacteria bacterium]|nr:hypothetical protein [Candidatus Kaiserbacteria bacterium]
MGKIAPLIWGYNYEDVIGSAEYREDGTMVMTVKDPRLVERFRLTREFDQETNLLQSIKGVSLYVEEIKPAHNQPDIRWGTKRLAVGYRWYVGELITNDPIRVSGWCLTHKRAFNKAQKVIERISEFNERYPRS